MRSAYSYVVCASQHSLWPSHYLWLTVRRERLERYARHDLSSLRISVPLQDEDQTSKPPTAHKECSAQRHQTRFGVESCTTLDQQSRLVCYDPAQAIQYPLGMAIAMCETHSETGRWTRNHVAVTPSGQSRWRPTHTILSVQLLSQQRNIFGVTGTVNINLDSLVLRFKGIRPTISTQVKYLAVPYRRGLESASLHQGLVLARSEAEL
ncbi:hypothetical protein FB567DRAFT_98373 [Paraphoma chrysanthemicola]|uniref:Uncharacterized protein n=1 Tax=Paraphoma chrysanthemicola TaxID=798071 RepID=A0A8K0R2F1_9PLEO|nr:hypothetical protein FB567DRAFT_98373 [Paraphoma chrysanthemicola]